MRKVGRWTVLGEIRKNGKKYYRCRCECGTEREVYYRSIDNGESRSCGCLRREITSERETIDLTGQRFGKLTVLYRDGNIGGFAAWMCECDCGRRKRVRSRSLLVGYTRSCGCIHREVAVEVGKKTIAGNSKEFMDETKKFRTNFHVIESKNLPKNNRSGHKGVSWDKTRELWSAYINVHGRQIHLGRYARIEDAIAARVDAEEKYFEPLIAEKGKTV